MNLLDGRKLLSKALSHNFLSLDKFKHQTMQFYENQLFHIYNQGNNRRQVFLVEENYEFFLWKMRAYIVPFGDFIAWCLMPNHFHWLFYVRYTKIKRADLLSYADQVEWQRRKWKYGARAQPVQRDWSRNKQASEYITLNEAVGTAQSSYGRAINKMNQWSGRIFKDNCQAKDGWIDEFVTLSKNGKNDFRFELGNSYGYQCLNYIHENPVKAKLVGQATDYKWSSAKDYANLRNGSLCNVKLGNELLGFI